jgi:hypothetical protein
MAKDTQAKQASAAKWQTAVSFGASVLGALLGRKTLSSANVGRAATAARGVGRSMKESSDVARADENVQAIRQQLAELEVQVQAETDAVAAKIDPATESLDKTVVRPKKSDILVKLLALAWTPYWRRSSGKDVAAWR